MPRNQARAMRAEILDAAEAAFARSGFHATKLRDIAKHIGITQPLIHHYFRSKDALFDAVVTRVVIDYEEAQAEQWDRDPADVRFFTEGVSVLFDFIGQHRQAARLMGWARLEGRMPLVPKGEAVDAKIRKKFVDAKKAGVLRPDVDVGVALLLIDAVTRGFWDRADDAPALRANASAITRALLEAILPSLLSDAALADARAAVAEGFTP